MIAVTIIKARIIRIRLLGNEVAGRASGSPIRRQTRPNSHARHAHRGTANAGRTVLLVTDITLHDMTTILPRSTEFKTPVYGTVFGQRSDALRRLKPGDHVILVPDPPGTEQPNVWVHAPGGDVVGHLAPDINAWLVPWMNEGVRCGGVVAQISRDDVASYKRLVIIVRCRASLPLS
jgi:hypothetical protein